MAEAIEQGFGGRLLQELHIFVRHRTSEILAISLFVAAFLLTSAFLGFSSSDPGPFNSTGELPENPLGSWGAWIAGGFMYLIGTACWILPFLLVGKAIRLLSDRKSNSGFFPVVMRSMWLVFAIFSTALFASCHLPWTGWLNGEIGLGGYIGDNILLILYRQSFTANPTWNLWLIEIFALVASLSFSALALGAKYSEIQAIAVFLWKEYAYIFGVVSGATRKIFSLFARDEIEEDREFVRTSPSFKKVEKSNSVRTNYRRSSFRPPEPTNYPATASNYTPPSLSFLERRSGKLAPKMTRAALDDSARTLETVLQDYSVRGEIIDVRPGPVVTLYEFEPAPGIKASRVISLADDIARSMSAVSARVATVPGRNVIGIELPNEVRERVLLRELLESDSYRHSQDQLPIALGKNIAGDETVVDLAPMPHLLIAGTTGSGKSVAINTMILSLLYSKSPRDCRMIMIDPKMLELSVYDGIPHLLTPVVTDPKKAIVALKWTVREMEERYRKMSRLGVRNISSYNERARQAIAQGEDFHRVVQTGFDSESGQPVYEKESIELEEMPYIVVIVDEMADLMMVAGKEIEACVQRLAQMARASGIHLVMATQRPSVDVVTGTIKANFPTRISFQVTSRIDSRTILGEQSAEQLLGQGDMLYMASGSRIERLHGPFVSDGEVEEAVRFLKTQGTPDYIDGITDGEDLTSGFSDFSALDESSGNSDDALYDQAVTIIAREQRASISFIQRKLQIGYNRAARIMERMEEQGIVSQQNNVGKRQVLVGEVG